MVATVRKAIMDQVGIMVTMDQGLGQMDLQEVLGVPEDQDQMEKEDKMLPKQVMSYLTCPVTTSPFTLLVLAISKLLWVETNAKRSCL